MNAVFSILPRVEIKVERIFVVLYRDGSSFKDATKIPIIWGMWIESIEEQIPLD